MDNDAMSEAACRTYWSRTKRLTTALLLAWLVVNLCVPWFARDFDRWHAFGFPVGYWLTAQGALLAYLAIVVIDVWVMERIETRMPESDAAAAESPPAGPA
jgi:putative solute:sodium symporter small subunit